MQCLCLTPFIFYVGFYSDIDLVLPQCGFKMFTRAAARKLFSNVHLKRWCFDVELVFLCKRFKIPISEVSVNWSEIPGSKVNLLSIPNMLWELVLMSVGYRTGMWRISNST
ncbi:hypothetical protein ACSQ67_023372 [Phaseolus vulgaris]